MSTQFNSLTDDIAKNLKEWEAWINSSNIHNTQPPKPYNNKSEILEKKLTPF